MMSNATAGYPLPGLIDNGESTFDALKIEDNRVAYDPTFNMKKTGGAATIVINPNHETVHKQLNNNTNTESSKPKDSGPAFQSNHSAEISLIKPKAAEAPPVQKKPVVQEPPKKEPEPPMMETPKKPVVEEKKEQPPAEPKTTIPNPQKQPAQTQQPALNVPKIFQDSEFPKTNIKSWLTFPAPRGRLIQCTIVRDRAGLTNKIYPKYHIYISVRFFL